MAQRALMAAAVAPDPDLLIADEPTSALDATTAEGIAKMLREISEERGMAALLITHDLGVVARFARRVIVMYAGRVVEQGPVDELFERPCHPTRAGFCSRSRDGGAGHLISGAGQALRGVRPSQRKDGNLRAHLLLDLGDEFGVRVLATRRDGPDRVHGPRRTVARGVVASGSPASDGTVGK